MFGHFQFHVFLFVLGGMMVHGPVPPVSNATVTRGPYLQLQTDSSMTVVWYTDEACQGEVEWGATTSYGKLEKGAASATRHEIAISGLSPDTLYNYRVRSNGTPLRDNATFRTAPSPSSTKVGFTVMGDSRSNPRQCQAILEAMIPKTPSGFCITLADLPGRGEDEVTDYWQSHFFTPAMNANFINNICTYVCIGNHELYNSDAKMVYPATYLDLWSLPTQNSGTELYYSFDVANIHFVALDVYWSSFSVDSEQYNWLVNDLATTTKPWKFVFMHNGPYVSQSGTLAGSSTIRSRLVPVFEQHDVDLVLYGHYHDYQRNIVNGVNYLLQGCGGAPLGGRVDENQPFVQEYASEFCFTRIDVDGDTLTGRTYTPDGTTVVDGFEINKSPVAFPWTESFPEGGTTDLHWIAPWNFETQCAVVSHTGNPSGDGQVLQLSDTSGHQFVYPLRVNSTLTNVSLEAQIYYDADTPVKNRYGIGLRGHRFRAATERKFYALAFVKNDPLATDGHCVLFKHIDGTETKLGEWNTPDVSGWRKLKLAVAGNALDVWIDGEKMTPTPILDHSAVRGRPFLYNFRDGGGKKTLADDVVIEETHPAPSDQILVEDFETWNTGTTVVFRHPGYSGSTSGIEPGSTAAVSDEKANDILDPQVGAPGGKSNKIAWQWTNAGTGYIRMTTSNTSNKPNPLLDLSQGLSIYYLLPSGQLDMRLQIKETGGGGPVGADGGTSGGIERTTNPIRLTATDDWQYAHFDIPNITAWTASSGGNGILEGEWGTLEALCFTAVANDPTTNFTLYIDDLYQGPPQHPR